MGRIKEEKERGNLHILFRGPEFLVMPLPGTWRRAAAVAALRHNLFAVK